MVTAQKRKPKPPSEPVLPTSPLALALRAICAGVSWIQVRERDIILLEAMIEQGEDLNPAEGSLLNHALASPSLCSRLIKLGARPDQKTLEMLVTHWVDIWRIAPNGKKQADQMRELREDMKSLCKQCALLSPQLDWYALVDNKHPTLPQYDMPVAVHLESEVTGFNDTLEKAQAQAGLPVGRQFHSDEDRMDALIDLLEKEPKQQHVRPQQRAAMVKKLLEEGIGEPKEVMVFINDDDSGNMGQYGVTFAEVLPALAPAFKLGNPDILDALITHGIEVTEPFLAWMGRHIHTHWQISGDELRGQRACLRRLGEEPGIDWHQRVSVGTGGNTKTLSEIVSHNHRGLIAEIELGQMERQTAQARNLNKRGLRL